MQSLKGRAIWSGRFYTFIFEFSEESAGDRQLPWNRTAGQLHVAGAAPSLRSGHNFMSAPAHSAAMHPRRRAQNTRIRHCGSVVALRFELAIVVLHVNFASSRSALARSPFSW